ncbi:Terminase large subunit [Laribacter hongkongensis HLHK9]|uniref:Terminase large subunit n=1 Tax=Laribacter hongkongensis (strain HLHK9) TaxID=557598 RepID=C1D7R1_LARHH|nr:hypothetical protein [Laribacter hongkongensis]ACO74501.1 Terminase large subunit [Laribacter hongkongensis HLHK9]
MADIDDELIELAAECATDPLRWALHAYDWGRGELEGVTGPRAWQREVMSDIGNHLKNPATRFSAFDAGRGLGSRHWQVGRDRNDRELGAFDLR